MSTPSALRPLTVVTGDEELLVQRAVRAIVRAARAADAMCEVIEVAGADFSASHLLDLATPSMFGGLRVFVVQGFQEATDPGRDALLRYLPDPAPDTVLVVTHNGAARHRAVVDAIRKAGGEVIRRPKVKAEERRQFVRDEAHAAGRRMSDEAARALVEAVGSDLRELAAAVAQLVADTEGNLDEAAVAAFRRGRAETTGFEVAEAALAGDAPSAVALLRAELATSDLGERLKLVGALAYKLREVASATAASPDPRAAAAELGVPDWRARRLLQQARGWSEPALATAFAAIAAVDAEVKGGADDVDFALERAVRRIAAARGLGRPAAGRQRQR